MEIADAIGMKSSSAAEAEAHAPEEADDQAEEQEEAAAHIEDAEEE
jgi:hypothetical protein